MKQQELPFKIRDKRKDSRYYIDNEFLNGYAKYVGWHGQVVYMALCRHSKDEHCYPSQKHLAIELGISEDSIKKGVKKLIEWKIIAKSLTRKLDGKFARNDYWLLDRSEWKIKPEQRWSNKGQPKV